MPAGLANRLTPPDIDFSDTKDVWKGKVPKEGYPQALRSLTHLQQGANSDTKGFGTFQTFAGVEVHMKKEGGNPVTGRRYSGWIVEEGGQPQYFKSMADTHKYLEHCWKVDARKAGGRI